MEMRIDSLGLILLAALMLPACRTTSPDPTPDAHWPSRASTHHSLSARDAWFAFQTAPTEDESEAALLRSLESIQSAVRSDARIALYHNQEGELHFAEAALHARSGDERGATESRDQARRAFGAAVSRAEEWVPGYLGLAKVATVEGQFDRADQHLLAATNALRELIKGPLDEPSFFESLIGISYAEQSDPLSPIPTRVEQRHLIVGQIAETERWALNATGEPAVPAEQAEPDHQLIRRLRDRIWYHQACNRRERALEAGQTQERVLRTFVNDLDQRVLARDGDLVEAYVDRIDAHLHLGNLREAEDDLNYLVASGLPLVHENARLLRQLMEVQLELVRRTVGNWIAGPTAGSPKLAVREINDLLTRLLGPPSRFEDLQVATLEEYVRLLREHALRKNSMEPLKEAKDAVSNLLNRVRDVEMRERLKGLDRDIRDAIGEMQRS